MPAKKKRDLNQLAARITEIATVGPPQEVASTKNETAAALGSRGGRKGGPARAKKLSKKRRSEIAKKGAKARWNK
jgi:hypothetical protein